MNKMMTQWDNLVRIVCTWFPPIIAPKIRIWFSSENHLVQNNFSFIKKSFTGSNFYGDTSDFHARKFYYHGYFDWRNVVLAREIIKHRKGIIVEVGANIGTETVSYADIPNAVVHAFEPLPDNFDLLTRNKDLNKFSNVHLHQIAIGHENSMMAFKVPAADASGAGHLEYSQSNMENTIQIPVKTLDSIFAGLQPISSIIVDVEGFEPEVIIGAKNIIENQRPFIIIELNKKFFNKKRSSVNWESFTNSFNELGYNAFYIRKLSLKSIDFKKFKVFSNKNCILVPKEMAYIAPKLSLALLKFGIFKL
jgi:FkbM family methyltransferase